MLQSRILLISALIVGVISVFALGVISTEFLGMILEPRSHRLPVATISLDLADRVKGLQEEGDRLDAALAESARRISSLERELAEIRKDDGTANTETRSTLARFETELQKTQQQNAALAAEIGGLNRERDKAEKLSVASLEAIETLRRDLANVIEEHNKVQQELKAENAALREALYREDREIALLRESVRDIEIRTPVGADAAPSPTVSPSARVRSNAAADEGRGDGSSVLDGVTAYKAGDYGQAYRIWQPLAESGNARAQFHLGALYYEGRGVTQDLSNFRVWLNRASERGPSLARSLLMRVEDELRQRNAVGDKDLATER